MPRSGALVTPRARSCYSEEPMALVYVQICDWCEAELRRDPGEADAIKKAGWHFDAAGDEMYCGPCWLARKNALASARDERRKKR
jgi:hypothetical protein